MSLAETPLLSPSRHLLRAFAVSVLAASAAVTLGFVHAAFEVFWLHDIDPKWGDAWGNVSIAVWLFAFTALVQAALLLVVLVIPFFSPVLRSPRAIVTCAASFALLTDVFFPPKATYPLLVAAALTLASALLGRLVSPALPSHNSPVPSPP